MKDCQPDPYFEKLKCPLMVLRPQKEMKSESVQAQLELAKKHKHTTYVAEVGTHGSSMLVPERAGGNVQKNWEAVWTFLSGIAQ